MLLQTDMHSRSLYANTHIYNLAFTHSNNTDKQCLSNQPRRSVARGLTGFPINVSLSNQKPFYVKGLQLFTVKVTLDLLNVEAIRQSSSSFRVPCFIHKRTSNSNSLSLITIKFTLNSNPWFVFYLFLFTMFTNTLFLSFSISVTLTGARSLLFLSH